MISGQRVASWGREAVWRSLELRCALSVRQYELLRSKNAPLVSQTSLRAWLRDFSVSQGEPEVAISWLGKHLEDVEDKKKVAILMFDEMALTSVLSYDPQKDQILGPHSQLQVVMATSLFGRWKVPVYFQVGISFCILFISTLYWLKKKQPNCSKPTFCSCFNSKLV